MNIVNHTTQKIVSEHTREARTLAEKTVGLLNSKNPAALFFRTRWGIHTFGMKFQIDVLVCDTEFRVCKIKQGLKPNRFFFWNPLWPNVFELPPGSIEKSNTTSDDILEIRPYLTNTP